MLYVYIETDETAEQPLYEVCLGTVEFDENPFVVWRGRDYAAANSQALALANKLRGGGATVQLH